MPTSSKKLIKKSSSLLPKQPCGAIRVGKPKPKLKLLKKPKKSLKRSFPLAMHWMLTQLEEHGGYDHIVSWDSDGTTFHIHNEELYMKEISPHFFEKHSNIRSLHRQLVLWGFTRTSRAKDNKNGCSFRHADFVRGDPNRAKNIARCGVKEEGKRAQKVVKREARKVANKKKETIAAAAAAAEKGMVGVVKAAEEEVAKNEAGESSKKIASMKGGSDNEIESEKVEITVDEDVDFEDDEEMEEEEDDDEEVEVIEIPNDSKAEALDSETETKSSKPSSLAIQQEEDLKAFQALLDAASNSNPLPSSHHNVESVNNNRVEIGMSDLPLELYNEAMPIRPHIANQGPDNTPVICLPVVMANPPTTMHKDLLLVRKTKLQRDIVEKQNEIRRTMRELNKLENCLRETEEELQALLQNNPPASDQEDYAEAPSLFFPPARTNFHSFHHPNDREAGPRKLSHDGDNYAENSEQGENRVGFLKQEQQYLYPSKSIENHSITSVNSTNNNNGHNFMDLNANHPNHVLNPENHLLYPPHDFSQMSTTMEGQQLPNNPPSRSARQLLEATYLRRNPTFQNPQHLRIMNDFGPIRGVRDLEYTQFGRAASEGRNASIAGMGRSRVNGYCFGEGGPPFPLGLQGAFGVGDV